jgi:hypothetical protein
MHFKSWNDISPPPNAAEQQLKAAAEAGVLCELGPRDQIPEEPANWQTLTAAQEARHIRAEVLRLILLNGDGCDVTKRSVAMFGAYISGTLDLVTCNVPSDLLLHHCRLENHIIAPRSKWAGTLRLQDCALPALLADGAKIDGQLSCSGTLFKPTTGPALNLRKATVKDDLILAGAVLFGSTNLNAINIGGQLACKRANFLAPGDDALDLQSATIGDGVFFNQATFVGLTHCPGTKITGQFSCEAASFNNPTDFALDLHGAEIAGDLILRNIAKIRGRLNLADAKTTRLVDTPDHYSLAGALILNGFRYDSIIGLTNAETRLDWLAKGDRWNGEFFPQPYKQLAKTLHDMGHEADARQVRITLACKLRQEARAKLRITPNGDLSTGLHSIWRDILRLCLGGKDSISLLLTAHGYKPQRSLYALILLFAAATFPAQWAWDEGSFAPNSGPILLSEGWQELARDDDIQNPAAEWANRNAIPGKDWETFNRYAYAADVVIPIVEFGQTEAWAPSTERGPWGYHLWWLRWVFTTLGWIVTALGAAALTGLIRRD